MLVAALIWTGCQLGADPDELVKKIDSTLTVTDIDDSGVFIKDYQEKKIFSEDPFAVLDAGGVGQLVEIAIQKGRHTRPDLEVGICGEHGGDPKSVEFCVHAGLNYVSASPYRVPIARLAAAQAALAKGKEETMRTA